MIERNCLIISVQSALNDSELSSLGTRIARQIAASRPDYAVLDLTGLDVVDSFAAQFLQRLCRIMRLYGVRVIVSSIHPDVAISMSMRDFDLHDAMIAIDLSEALELVDNHGLQRASQKAVQPGITRHQKRP